MDLVYYWLGYTDDYRIKEHNKLEYKDEEADEKSKYWRHKMLKQIRNRQKAIDAHKKLQFKLSYAHTLSGKELKLKNNS